MTEGYRTERDSMGDVKVPEHALYAAQTQRAVDNFNISRLTLPSEMITAIAYVKAAAAKANVEVGSLSQAQADAIVAAAQQLIDGQHREHFPIDVFRPAPAPVPI